MTPNGKYSGPARQASDLPEAARPQRADHRHEQRRDRGHRVQEHYQQNGGLQKYSNFGPFKIVQGDHLN